MKLPKGEEPQSIGELAYKTMTVNTAFHVLTVHSKELFAATAELSQKENQEDFLLQVCRLNGIQSDEIPLQIYQRSTIMKDGLKEMIEFSSENTTCTLEDFYNRAQYVAAKFDEGLQKGSAFFTQNIKPIEECLNEKEALLYDVTQRHMMNKFFDASQFLNGLSQFKEEDEEEGKIIPMKHWYINLHLKKACNIWLDKKYNLDLANPKYVGPIHRYEISVILRDIIFQTCYICD